MRKGFTLIEIMVALMIFSIVVVVALSALVKIIDANKKAQTIQDAVVGMSFTMESMAREIRTGSTLYCAVLAPGADVSVTSLSSQSVGPCNGVTGNGGNGVGFAFLSTRTDASNPSCRLINSYELVPDQSSSGTFLFKKASQQSCGAALSFAPVIDTQSVTLTGYYLAVSNVQYPLLFVKMDGVAGTKENVKTYFTIQTASSPREP